MFLVAGDDDSVIGSLTLAPTGVGGAGLKSPRDLYVEISEVDE